MPIICYACKAHSRRKKEGHRVAENESLELGGAYAKRWEVPLAFVKKGASSEVVTRKLDHALVAGLRKTLKQLQGYGVTLSDMLAARSSRQALKQLIRKTEGHEYVHLFADATAMASDPSTAECLRGWIDAILDKISDQICHRVAGSELWPNIYEVNRLMQEVREALESRVEQMVTDFVKDPASKPRQRKSAGISTRNSTADLLGLSLLAATKS